MTIEEEFNAYKAMQLKHARRFAFVLGSAAVLAILFMIYGITQTIEANMQRELRDVQAEDNAVKIENLQKQLEECKSK